MTDNSQIQICNRAVFNSTVPGVQFDDQGIANYCRVYDNMAATYPLGEVGKKQWEELVQKIKQKGQGKKYDCVIGVSGGTDSSYLMHLAHQHQLRVLAVYVDNGWSTDISVRNIKKMTTALKIDLTTQVLHYEEIKDLMRCYMKAKLPWIDFPTDFAIQASLFHAAKQENIPYIFIGYDFRSEGKQPTEWTYGDYRQLKSVHRRFGSVPLKTYPSFSFFKLFYWSVVRKIKMIRPFYFVDYKKEEAKRFLKETYGWEDYGGHHHENAFTRFAITNWLPNKFGIDKRIITLSALVLSKQLTREEALKQLAQPPLEQEQIKKDQEYVLKKLSLTPADFNQLLEAENKSFKDYPSYYPLIYGTMKLMLPLFRLLFPWKPALFFEMEVRKNN
jgi:N-acetyl sugar amidotransferase